MFGYRNRISQEATLSKPTQVAPIIPIASTLAPASRSDDTQAADGS